MQTLVLDKAYRPTEVVSWERAVTLLFEGKAEVVTEYEDHEIHSVSLTWKTPAVIRLLYRLKPGKKAIKFSRHNIWSRDCGRCAYCGNKVRREVATYDHVVPRAQGGQTTWTNIVIACVLCNQKKRDRTPAQAGMSLRIKPVRPDKLPDGSPSYILTWRKSHPPEWRAWLTDASYWMGTLESDE